MTAQSSSPALPTSLNLGSGKDFRSDFFNLDVDDTWAPDAVCDLSIVPDLTAGLVLKTARFGEIRLYPSCFDEIVANDVLEHVPDLMTMMTRCLELLRIGGTFHISVPYDLSFGAWQDPTHVRAFNERSWLYYTDWFWYMGWSESRFMLESFEFVPSPLGEALKAKDIPREDIIRTPRAIDSMKVVLRKVELSGEDRATWEFWRERKREAQHRKTLSSADAMPPITSARAAEPVSGTVSNSDLRAFDGPIAAQLNRYALWIVTPENYTHQCAYDDLAIGLSEAFAELGGSAPIVRDPTQTHNRTLIVLGPQLLPPSALQLLPKACILFNLEQIQHGSPWITTSYLSLLRQHPVLDYSLRNRDALASLGIAHARVLPIGYAPALARIPQGQDKDIDVLFYGSLNDRRRKVLEALAERNIHVHHLFGVYGAERDKVIGRAKVVLNMHFYEAAIFEAVRVTFLLSNGACVLSEGDDADPELAPYIGGLCVAPYSELVDRCIDLLQSDVRREALARDGLNTIKRRPQVDLLRSLFID